jgi:hypothetical protein
VVEKLSHQIISVRPRLGKQQSSGGKTIDAMHDQGSLPLRLESRGEQRQSRRMIGALNRHSQKSSRFVQNHHGIVFVKHGEFTRETRPSPVFVGRSSILFSPTAANLARNSLHWQSAPRTKD